ncbi:MAG: protein kinase [Bryobacteraceae bacterium]
MRTCPNCQRNYADEMDFCPRDAAPLSAPAAVTEFDLSVGLSRRYRIVRRLGEGGMGTVFLAEQLAVGNRPVALKVLRRKLLDDPDFLHRFQDEASSTGRIRHQNVVTVHECGQTDDGSPYIAMEYLEGESLRQTLKRRGSLPLPEIATILQQTARGLNAAHKLGIIHRDLKPDNIFLTQDDDGKPLVKIVDFGIAKMREANTHTVTGGFLGTPAYMSVEQASGMRSDQLDGRSDIYSLAIVTYEMIAGRVPFQADTPMAYLKKHLIEPPPSLRLSRPDLRVSPQVEAALMKALKKERVERYATAPDFAREFALAVSTQTRPKTTEKARVEIVPRRKFPTSLTVAATVLMAAIALGGWYALSTRAPATPDRTAIAVPASEPQKQAPPGMVPQPEPTQKPAPPPVLVRQPSAQSKTSRRLSNKFEAPPSATPKHPTAPANDQPPPKNAESAEAPSVQRAHTQLDPDVERKTKAAVALGDLHYNRGEYDEAIAEYQRGLQADPANAILRTKIDRAEKARAAELRVNH